MDTNSGYLLADAAHPLISSGPVWEEALLYGIPAERVEELCASFERISGKALSSRDILSELSGGQKVILMACMAAFSAAKKIRCIDLEHSLDAAKHEAVKLLLESSGKAIRYEEGR